MADLPAKPGTLRRQRPGRLQRHLPPCPPLQLILAQVDGDSKQPAPYPFPVTAAVEAPKTANERALHDIRGVVRAPGHALRVAVQHVLVPAHENPVRLAIAFQNGGHDIRVARFIVRNPTFRPDPKDLLFVNKTTSTASRSLKCSVDPPSARDPPRFVLGIGGSNLAEP